MLSSTSDIEADHPFDVDTAVEPTDDGAFTATLSDRWNGLLGGPLGGYPLAISLQALRQTMPFPDPLVLSAFFLRPARTGQLDVQTEAVRRGRRMATSEARLIQDGKECARVVATFTDLAQASGRTVVLNAPPQLAPPDQAIDPLAGRSPGGVTIADRIEFRMPRLPGWLTGEPTGTPSAEVWARLKGGREPDLFTLALMVDSSRSPCSNLASRHL